MALLEALQDRPSIDVEHHRPAANDLWIAGQALAERATLVTNNTREFQRLEASRLEDGLYVA